MKTEGSDLSLKTAVTQFFCKIPCFNLEVKIKSKTVENWGFFKNFFSVYSTKNPAIDVGFSFDFETNFSGFFRSTLLLCHQK